MSGCRCRSYVEQLLRRASLCISRTHILHGAQAVSSDIPELRSSFCRIMLEFSGYMTKLGNSRRSARARDQTADLGSPGETDYYTNIFGELRWFGEAEDLASTFPMDGFPPELLAESFYWYILEVYQGHSCWLEGCFTPYCWMVIRHVCRAWRHVALTFPKLSTLITLCTRAECVQDLLNRSGNLPLHVRARAIRHTFAADLLQESTANGLILQHLGRAIHSEFHLFPHAAFYPADTNDPAAMVSALPNLRSLKLIQHHLCHDGTPLFPQFTFPNLTDLTLSARSLRVGSRAITSTLRRLVVSRISSAITVEEVASYLEPLTRLEVLVIQDLWSSNPEDGTFPAPENPISLPRLRHLFLRCCTFETGLHLLRSLSCPSATTTFHYAAMTFSRSYPPLISAVVSLFQDKIGEAGLDADNVAAIRSIVLQFGKDGVNKTADFWMNRMSMCPIANKMELSNAPHWRRQHAGNFETLDLELQHSFPTFQFSTTDPESEDFLLHLLPQLPMSTVESVRLMDVGPVPRHLDDGWKDVFASMVNVEELVLDYIAGTDSVRWCTSDDAQTSSLFPSVASVVLIRRFLPHRRPKRVRLSPYGTFRLEHLAEHLVARHRHAEERGGHTLGPSMFSLETSVVTSGCDEGFDAADVSDGVNAVIGDESGATLNNGLQLLWNRMAHTMRLFIN